MPHIYIDTAMKNLWRESILLVTISSLFCLINSTTNSHSKTANSEVMNNLISIVEIPASNINRAVKFYESILDIEIQSINMQGTEMGIFPSDGQLASVVLTKGEGYEPASSGVLVHLNGGEDLEPILKKVEQFGGEILLSKTLIDEENGYFALFLDSEGNRMGLHSMK
ncbi:VOC family protein [Roseivirga sp.]|jgi:hypothetical protein|uniref:VOC family protein n=1 Tax=Roseivirga sp. TaxID=1964215 RepID=UPI0023547AA7|nr:VOC family protein [Roseivirga sp.]